MRRMARSPATMGEGPTHIGDEDAGQHDQGDVEAGAVTSLPEGADRRQDHIGADRP